MYLASHPVLFALLALARHRPVVRLGRRVVVNDPDALRTVLTAVPLDRTSPLTTGGVVHSHGGRGLFDEEGPAHRTARRELGARLDSRGVAALRPTWLPVLDDAAAALRRGDTVDVAALADTVSGRATAVLLGRPDLDAAACRALASAARDLAAVTVAAELPGVRRARRGAAEGHLAEVFGLLGGPPDPLAATLAVAAVTTTRVGMPRAVAWCADAGLWDAAADPSRRDALVGELLRVTTPTPVLPRVPAEDAVVSGCPVARGRQLVLVARHAVGAHHRDPDPDAPAPAALAQLVFGAGPHACPGAALARAQLADVLAVLAPLRPVVVSARADRRAALPSWRELRVRAGEVPR
ncbi:hypothetical protein JQN72_01940 [Phycicoccus sp. CSK15P-2]|uniref:hypothetical protein n=1 Tax=Phycicoccus sp. CSK15P-2 TaxID=2807627 RepID=UPI0019504BBB|nr:hypothetical protein [Phycicoccus sp. CSK15P-2]MBM6403009.1 hypothetical protein [Phycicoccus sp. CSK15P-2]